MTTIHFPQIFLAMEKLVFKFMAGAVLHVLEDIGRVTT